MMLAGMGQTRDYAAQVEPDRAVIDVELAAGSPSGSLGSGPNQGDRKCSNLVKRTMSLLRRLLSVRHYD